MVDCKKRELSRVALKESLMIISSLKNNCPAVCVVRCHRSHGKSVKKKYSNFLNIKRCISFFLRSKDGFLSRKIDEVYFFYLFATDWKLRMFCFLFFFTPVLWHNKNWTCSTITSFNVHRKNMRRIKQKIWIFAHLMLKWN